MLHHAVLSIVLNLSSSISVVSADAMQPIEQIEVKGQRSRLPLRMPNGKAYISLIRRTSFHLGIEFTDFAFAPTASLFLC